MQIEIGFGTHQGRRRDTNQDTVGVFEARGMFRRSKKSPLLVVADGMGGHRGGAVASHMSVEAAGKAYQRATADMPVDEVLLSGIMSANEAVREKAEQTPALDGMGTTIVAAMMNGMTVYMANVGDSRGYIIHGDEMVQVTDDHSLVAEQVRIGALTKEQAAVAAGRNVITRALGRRGEIEVDMFSVDWEPGDALLLCSDGLWGQVSDPQMLIVIQEMDVQPAVEQLIRMAMRSHAPDNIGVIVARLKE